jgi:hypothetical protein
VCSNLVAELEEVEMLHLFGVKGLLHVVTLLVIEEYLILLDQDDFYIYELMLLTYIRQPISLTFT